MRRRTFLKLGGLSLSAGLFHAEAARSADSVAVRDAHFPDRLHLFVWRNWELVPLERLAAVVRCRPDELRSIATNMGLAGQPRGTAEFARRGYITIIRQNWHVLPEDQLIQLLGWTRDKFHFTLREDDFLEVKLGAKSACEPLHYTAPDAPARQRAQQIQKVLRSRLGSGWTEPGEPAFDFVRQLSSHRQERPAAADTLGREPVFRPRYVYPFFALYGDPLMEPEIDPFPDGYLEKLSQVGLDGVWMQCVLNTLAPSRTFPEFGQGWQTRLTNLRRLVERAGRFGLKMYLYLNEPRAMPARFFERHPDMRGTHERDRYALCTASPAVREWLAESLTHVFRHVPNLGGVFAITMSENLTNCWSHGNAQTCPRCRRRKDWQAVSDVLTAIHKGVRQASSKADIIFWDWGWPETMAQKLIPRLPRDVRLLSVSEWSIPVERGGVRTTVGEYSISVVGPGPRATAHWKLARAAGVAPLAKTQFNNTWEISAVPYIPVAYLIARHCTRLVKAGVQGLMASWTLGGYPSVNLEIVREICYTPHDGMDTILSRVARRHYGPAAAPLVLSAWQAFSQAFEEYPYGVDVYCIPTQHGPANLLQPKLTGRACGMILYPWDNYKAWCGVYPPMLVRDQFARLAERWRRGLSLFAKAMQQTPKSQRAQAILDLAIAETCGLHFQSVANQIEFYLLRDGRPTAASRARQRALVESEIDLARRLYPLVRRHSVLAYEASNHYYYRPLDVAEQILNCQHWLDNEGKG